MSNGNQPLVDVVTTPTEGWLRAGISSCRSRLVMASPYVNEALSHLLHELSSSVRTTLVTRTDIRDFAAGASNLETLYTLAGQGVRVMSLTRLHAKVYVLDRSRALVTSANATWSGMRANRECGVAIYDSRIVAQLERQVLSGLGAEAPPIRMSSRALSALSKPVDVIRSSAPPARTLDTSDAFAGVPLPLPNASDLVQSLTGWTALTLDFVLDLPNNQFTLREVYEGFTPIAERHYPDNKHVHDKIRQQLQRLHHLGLLEFLGGGVYLRTITRGS